jgi:UDP-4-amino-4-deoxy-L-arabinose-oxoglutarate aminotransferase
MHGMSADAAGRYGGNYRHWDMIELGYKYNLTNLQAAMLLPQLRRIDDLRAARERLSLRYEDAFRAVEGIGFPSHAEGASARQMFTVWVAAGRRDRLLEALSSRGIGVAVNYRAVHTSSYYRERFGFRGGELPVAESIGDRTISLPLYPLLRDDEQERVIEELRALHAS